MLLACWKAVRGREWSCPYQMRRVALSWCLLYVVVDTSVVRVSTRENMIDRIYRFPSAGRSPHAKYDTALNFHLSGFDNRDGACAMEPRANAL